MYRNTILSFQFPSICNRIVKELNLGNFLKLFKISLVWRITQNFNEHKQSNIKIILFRLAWIHTLQFSRWKSWFCLRGEYYFLFSFQLISTQNQNFPQEKLPSVNLGLKKEMLLRQFSYSHCERFPVGRVCASISIRLGDNLLEYDRIIGFGPGQK